MVDDVCGGFVDVLIFLHFFNILVSLPKDTAPSVSPVVWHKSGRIAMLVSGTQRVQEYPPDAGGTEIEMERWKSLYLSVPASGEGGRGQTESSGPGMAKDS